MDKKLALVSGLVALVVAGGVVYLAPQKVIVGPAQKEIVREVVKEVKELGAIPGIEVSGNEFSIGGFRTLQTRVPFAQGTSSLCTVAKPHFATATLAFFGAVFNSGVATGTSVNVSMSIEDTNDPKTIPSATTSANVIGTHTLGTGAVNTVTASTTIGAAGNIVTRTATSAYAYLLVANAAAGDYRGYAPQGFCNVLWYVY